MKSRDYEYTPSEEECEISAERRDELIRKVKDQLRKGFIAHYQILDIGQNDNEYDFLYNWLDHNHIQIRGINSTISGEIPNYTHIPKVGQSLTPETLDDEEQEKLFWELHNFSDEDKKNNILAYQKVRNELVEHNMKLANYVANLNGIRKLKIPKEDRSQMAYLGLIDAVERFDPSLGYKFSTYASRIIYFRIIKEAYKDNGVVKQTIIVNEQLAMLPDIEAQILAKLGRKAKPYEIADILGVSLERVRQLETLRNLQQKESLDSIKTSNQESEKVFDELSDNDRVTQTGNGYVMDGVYVDEENILPVGFRKEDSVADKATVSTLKEEFKEAVIKALPDERYQNVVLLRFGLVDGRIRTYKEIAMLYNVSETRINQIEKKALRILQRSKIKDYDDGFRESRNEYEEI